MFWEPKKQNKRKPCQTGLGRKGLGLWSMSLPYLYANKQGCYKEKERKHKWLEKELKIKERMMKDYFFSYYWKLKDVLLLLMWKSCTYTISHVCCFCMYMFCLSLSWVPFGFHSCTHWKCHSHLGVVHSCHSSWLTYLMTLIWFWRDRFEVHRYLKYLFLTVTKTICSGTLTSYICINVCSLKQLF